MPNEDNHNLVTCETLFGEQILLPHNNLTFRPAAYAIILHDRKVLLLNTRSTGKYSLPGGGVEIGERMTDALHREVCEETGLKIAIEGFAGFREHFFYYEPWDEAFHSFLFYYLCRPLTFELLQNDEIEDEEVESPQWVALDRLCAEDLQSHGSFLMNIFSTIDG